MDNHEFKKLKTVNRKRNEALISVMKHVAQREWPDPTWSEEEHDAYGVLRQAMNDAATGTGWRSGSRYRWLRPLFNEFMKIAEVEIGKRQLPLMVTAHKATTPPAKTTPAKTAKPPRDEGCSLCGEKISAGRFCPMCQEGLDNIATLLAKGPMTATKIAGALEQEEEFVLRDLHADARFIKVRGCWTLTPSAAAAKPPSPALSRPIVVQHPAQQPEPEVEDEQVEVDESFYERDLGDNSPDEPD
jgi:hypothetical protein